jgi:poly(hydroxyalkanoate) depolymerase family esterase
MLLNVIAWFIWFITGAGLGVLTNPLRFNRYRDRRWDWTEVLVGILGAFLGGFILNQIGFVSITDFNPWSLIAAPIGALVLIFIYRLFQHDERNRVRRAGIYQPELIADLEARTAIKNEEKPVVRVIREPVRVDDRLLLAAILFIPFLDMLLFRVRIPDISQNPPDFGVVDTYSNEYGKLDYLVYAPAAVSDNTELPLVMVLHGCTQDPTMLESGAGMTEVADANNFLLVYPQQNAAASPHRCWNWYSPRNQARDSGEPSLLMGIVEEVRQNYSVDASRIYVTGLSSGGAMTSILASCYPDVFAAAAVHSGMGYKSANSVFQALIAPFNGNQMPPDAAGQAAHACSGNSNRPIPVMVYHGTADTVVFHVNAGDTLEQFAQMNDFADDGQDNNSVQAIPTNTLTQEPPDAHPYTIEDFAYNGQLLFQVYSIGDMGHMWGGGTGRFPVSDPQAPNASQIFWDFMSAYTLP